MKKCDDCPAHDGGCNWLDAEDVCPHCGGELRWFRGTALGDAMDELSMMEDGDDG